MTRYIKYKSISTYWLFKWLGITWSTEIPERAKGIEIAKTGFRIFVLGKAVGLVFNYDTFISNYRMLTRGD